MADFYPPYDQHEDTGIEQTGDYAVNKVLKALCLLEDDWRVFHKLGWRNFDREAGEKVGETDIILFHPKLGILVIEVKQGGVICRNGEWFYVSLFDKSERPMKNPFDQARKNRYSIFDKLKGTTIGKDFLDATGFTHTAWFPDITWQGDEPLEVPHGGFILDSRHLANPAKQLRKILRDAKPDAKSWNRQQIDMMMRVLAPEVNLLPALGAMLGDIRAMLFRMTEGQIRTLRALRSQKRLLVEGCAGSGKTLLAVALAREHLRGGKCVLFTCFNKNLAETIASDLEGCDNITVFNFHELVRRFCEQASIHYSVPEGEGKKEFFDTACADLLMQASGNVSMKFDTLIVDEALDFKVSWWIAIMSLLKDDGSFYVFYDRNQNLFNEARQWSPPFDGDPILLDLNVRNTKPVGDYAASIGNISTLIECAVKKGPAPEVLYYSVADDISRILVKLIENLVKNLRVSAEDIVVLSPYRYDSQHLMIKELVETREGVFTTQMTSRQGKIRIGTIQAFKGLEADVVILCGIDGHLPACSPSNLYVGATRARSMLYVIQST